MKGFEYKCTQGQDQCCFVSKRINASLLFINYINSLRFFFPKDPVTQLWIIIRRNQHNNSYMRKERDQPQPRPRFQKRTMCDHFHVLQSTANVVIWLERVSCNN
jgi:hypothetical protein